MLYKIINIHRAERSKYTNDQGDTIVTVRRGVDGNGKGGKLVVTYGMGENFESDIFEKIR